MSPETCVAAQSCRCVASTSGNSMGFRLRSVKSIAKAFEDISAAGGAEDSAPAWVWRGSSERFLVHGREDHGCAAEPDITPSPDVGS